MDSTAQAELERQAIAEAAEHGEENGERPAGVLEHELERQELEGQRGEGGELEEHELEDDAAEAEQLTVQAAVSEAELEKAMSRLEGEAKRHAKRVGEIMGEDATALELCPRCLPNIPGFIYPPEVAPVPDEVKEAVRESIGDPSSNSYRRAENTRTCDTCGGLGRVLSGSHVAGQELILCPGCPNGRGWIQVGGPAGEPPAVAAGLEGDEPQVAAAPPADTDPWGRSRTDPNYGVMPGYES